MDSDLVPCPFSCSRQLGVRRHLTSDEEKSCWRVGFLKHCQYLRRNFWVGAVIKSEKNLTCAAGRRFVIKNGKW
jgi:hypothetical protein